VQSVPISTIVMSLNPVHGKAYSIQHYVIKFVRDLRQVGPEDIVRTRSFSFITLVTISAAEQLSILAIFSITHGINTFFNR
jgi:hypothetical protein